MNPTPIRTSPLGRMLLTAAVAAAALVPSAPFTQGAESAGGAKGREGRPPIRENYNVRYVPGKEPRQVLDVFAPAGAKDRPVVLFVHGGTWMGGDKDFFGLYRSVGQFFARHGYVAVLPNYRLAPLHRHPAQVDDVARAYAWTRAHIKEYGGDPDRIVLSGHSAGGHLAALLATDDALWKDPALKLKPSDRKSLRAVVVACGVYRIPDTEEAMKMLGELIKSFGEMNNAGRPLIATAILPAVLQVNKGFNPFRLVFGTSKEARRDASPLSHVRKGLPPFLVLYAEDDLPDLPEMARQFASALKKAGDTVVVHEVPGTTHNTIMWTLNQPDNRTARDILQFLDKYVPVAPAKRPATTAKASESHAG